MIGTFIVFISGVAVGMFVLNGLQKSERQSK